MLPFGSSSWEPKALAARGVVGAGCLRPVTVEAVEYGRLNPIDEAGLNPGPPVTE